MQTLSLLQELESAECLDAIQDSLDTTAWADIRFRGLLRPTLWAV